MKRLLIAGAVVLAAAFALRHPPARAGLAAVSMAASPAMHPPRVPSAHILVYVVGAVRRSGVYRLTTGSRAADALQRAGGFTPSADPASVNLAQPVTDGEEIRVLPQGVATPVRRQTLRRKRARKHSASNDAGNAVSQLDINAADAQTLSALPGVGAVLAARIVAYRSLNGPFETLDELADVAGMTQRRVDAIAPYLIVRGSP